MRLRTFTASDMPSAMRLVREALGDSAIILHTETHKGKGPVTLTAAIDENDPPPPPPKHVEKPAPIAPMRHNNAEADELRFELQELLRFHNLPELFIAKLMQQASDKELASIQALQSISSARDADKLLARAVEKLAGGFFRFEPLALTSPGLKLMLVGPPGIGKTLTIAKIAAKLVTEAQARPGALTVITTDNKRAGGFEQLQSLTNILGIELRAANSAKELRTLLQSAAHQGGTLARVLIDTAGCNPYDRAELDELKTYATLSGIEPVMVLPAGGDSLETIDIVEAFSDIPAERLLVTRTDTARRFGGILAAAAAHKFAFSHASGSSSVIDSLHPMDPAYVAKLLLQYRAGPHS